MLQKMIDMIDMQVDARQEKTILASAKQEETILASAR